MQPQNKISTERSQVMFDADKAKRLAELARDDDATLPAGPWEVWTSNSFRRISGPDGRDGGVLHATRQRDGHPDLSAGPEMLTALCRMRNRHADLADQLAAACAEVERLRADVSACMSLVNIHDECRNSAERECDRLRAQTREACSIAEWALSVVCGDIPMFRNGETRTKRAALAAIRHDAGLGDDTPSDV